MAKWEQLIAARERKHLSQMEAAECLNVGLVTYQRWEAGKRKPQPQHMRRLCESFGRLIEVNERDSLQEEALFSTHGSDPATAVVGVVFANKPDDVLKEDTIELRSLLTANMTSHLWSLAFMDHPTCSAKRISIRQAIKEFDSMNINDKNYQITRREALWSLATLPMITLGLTVPGRLVSPNQYESAIAHCAASLEACWAVHRSSDPSQTILAFKCSSKYMSVLQAVGQDSPSHRQEALDLATRYALLKTLGGWACIGPMETIQYAKEAVALSKETEDISLQLSAYSKLAWAYFWGRKDSAALTTAKEAEMILIHDALSPRTPPLHPCIQGGTYSTLALMLAKNGQSPYTPLGKAAEASQEESHAFMTSKRSTLLLEAGWTYCYYGDQAKAMETLEKRVDPEMLQPKFAQSAMGQVESINVMTLSSLKTKDRDIEKTIHLWKAGIEGAKTLQNEQRFSEALTNYELMEVVWPNERRITDLRDHIVHWEDESK